MYKLVFILFTEPGPTLASFFCRFFLILSKSIEDNFNELLSWILGVIKNKFVLLWTIIIW